MEATYLLAIDLGSWHFQVCGTDASGKVLFNRSCSRPKSMALLPVQARCIVTMEAYSSSHHCGREVRVIPPIYVKSFVNLQKNNAADAEAIAEMTRRPKRHLVAVKDTEHQARAVMGRSKVDPGAKGNEPWNAGRRIGAKRACKPQQVCARSRPWRR